MQALRWLEEAVQITERIQLHKLNTFSILGHKTPIKMIYSQIWNIIGNTKSQSSGGWHVSGSGERKWNKEWVSMSWQSLVGCCRLRDGHIRFETQEFFDSQKHGKASANVVCLYFVTINTWNTVFWLHIWLKWINWTFGNKQRLLLLDDASLASGQNFIRSLCLLIVPAWCGKMSCHESLLKLRH